MSEHEASRTLVKSAPELWAECSDAASLRRHLGSFGEIRITKLDPETAVAWEGQDVRGTVTLEPSGWGTRVTLTAVAETRAVGEGAAPPAVIAELEAAEVAEALEAAGPEAEELEAVAAELEAEEPVAAEPVAEELEAEELEAAEDEPAVAPRGFWARLRARLRGGQAVPVADPPALATEPHPSPEIAEPAGSAPDQPARPAPAEPAPPAPAQPAPPAPDEPAPPTLRDELTALNEALDSLGRAHHRPYSRT